jgi:LmbE family N-acetylglucosaminyl deacetylase
MRILCVHAHFDDFEFVAAGTFELFRRKHAPDFRAKIVVCTDGRSGHQFRTREETARIRLEEQAAAAKIGGYEFERLCRPDGRPFGEARLLSNDLLAALWKTIRDFEPDYLFCPPLPPNTTVGVHPDHITVAEAVRRVAYMINVPHAFLDEYPVENERESRWIRTPVILTAYDGYMGAGAGGCPGLVIELGDAFEQAVRQSWCHQSQIREWLPWVGRHDIAPPDSLDAWRHALERRYAKQRRGMGLGDGPPVEVFGLTAWGEAPEKSKLEADFPKMLRAEGFEAFSAVD